MWVQASCEGHRAGAQPGCRVEVTSVSGEDRQRTRTVSRFPRDSPGLPLDCLDAGVRRTAQVCRLRVARDNAWARMMETQVSDDGSQEAK